MESINLLQIMPNSGIKEEDKERISIEVKKVFDNSSKSVPDCRIRNMKNAYLSLYEKSYYKNTFLITANLLLLNYDIVYCLANFCYYNEILKEAKLDKKIFIFNIKLSEIILRMVQM
jgi:hypothetical protein